MASPRDSRSPLASGLAHFVLGISACSSTGVGAAPLSAHLVRDLNDADMPAGSGAAVVGELSPGVELLIAYKPTTGRELYRFDVSTGAVAMVKDINPGPGSSSIQYLTVVNGAAFFQAFTPRDGWELWRSDGTAAGTRLVKDIWPGVGGSYPSTLMKLDGRLLFGACSAQGDCGLWRSDGTAAGTTVVKGGLQLNVGTDAPGVELGGRLYFGASESGGAGYELWSSDGTAAGTTLVKDIFPGGGNGYAWSSYPSRLVVSGSVLFFTARDASGTELWKSDGTAAGTAMVKDLWPGASSWGDPNGSYPVDLAAVGGQLVFAAYYDQSWTRYLFRSDGTEGGTVRLRDAEGGMYPCSDYYSGGPVPPAVMAGSLFLAASYGGSGCELWKTDGTDAGTVLVKDIWPGTDYYGYGNPSYPRNLTVVDGSVFFTAKDDVNGRELWKSNGTDAGTMLVRDITPSAIDPYGSYGPANLAAAGPLLLFSADDGTTGGELWRSDGTGAGTVLAKDIWASTDSSGPKDLAEMNGVIYLAARSGDHWALWRSDGTEAGTKKLMEAPEVACWPAVGKLTAVGDRLFFYSCNSGRVELWTSDGTVAGTQFVATFDSLDSLVGYKGEVYFGGYTYTDGGGLWKSDGTAAGTVRIGSAMPYQMTVVGDTLYFSADDGITGFELWKTDGTVAGTGLVKDIYPGMAWESYPNSSYPRHLMALGARRLLFFAWTADVGVELWSSDGTAAGTRLVKDIWPGEYGSSGLMPEDSDDLYGQGAPLFTEYQGKLWFVGCDADAGCEPWSTDGTTAGTTRLKDILPGPASSAFSYFMWGMYPRYSGPRFGTLNGALFFGAYSGGSGFELWKSDGTEAGTQLLQELIPGDGYSASLFDSFTAASGTLFFIGCKSNNYDRFQDCNLWKTDGTEDGTELALEAPLSFDGDSYYFNGNNRMAVAGGGLYFPATDDEHSVELFRIAAAAAPSVSPSVTGTLGLEGWYVSDVKVSWNVDAGGAPIIASEGCGSTLVSADTAGRRFTCSVATSSGTASAEVTIKRDATPPRITISTPGDGLNYLTDSESLLATYACADTTSGILDCSGTAAIGDAIDTSGVGPRSFAVQSQDRAGNVAASTSSYRLVYGFSGFFPPIAGATAARATRAGSVIPLKWKLWDGKGRPVTSLQSFSDLVSSAVSCVTTSGDLTGEQARSPGATMLRYDGLAGQFIFNWATDRNWRGCRLLQLTLGDGTRKHASFDFD